MINRAVLFGALTIWVAASAMADPIPRVYEACAADHQRVCSQQSIASEGSLRCLRQHSADVSPDCRAALNARRDWILDRVRTACGDEIRAHCSRGGGRSEVSPIRCLRAYEARLSEACRSAIPRQSAL
jgi:hypothetical protein